MKICAIFNNSFFTNKPKWMPKKLHRGICSRSNPRSKQYMIDLLHEKFPNAKLIDENNITSKPEQIILLYPDAIGLGYGNLENSYLKRFKNIIVLNGRRRSFKLTSSKRNKLLLRRFLEITLLFEIICAPFLLFAGIILAIKDQILEPPND